MPDWRIPVVYRYYVFSEHFVFVYEKTHSLTVDVAVVVPVGTGVVEGPESGTLL